MARNRQFMQARRELVFEVLADPSSYGHWVVGSKEIRDADDAFPRPGTRFHHTVGWGPFDLADHTEVLDADPPRLLKLRARARPAGTAMVTLELEDAETGTMVTMIEDPADPLTAFLFQPLTHLLVRRRNSEALRRLRELVERRRDHPGDRGGAAKPLAPAGAST